VSFARAASWDEERFFGFARAGDAIMVSKIMNEKRQINILSACPIERKLLLTTGF
jgi:hypothetical protein